MLTIIRYFMLISRCLSAQYGSQQKIHWVFVLLWFLRDLVMGNLFHDFYTGRLCVCFYRQNIRQKEQHPLHFFSFFPFHCLNMVFKFHAWYDIMPGNKGEGHGSHGISEMFLFCILIGWENSHLQWGMAPTNLFLE